MIGETSRKRQAILHLENIAVNWRVIRRLEVYEVSVEPHSYLVATPAHRHEYSNHSWCSLWDCVPDTKTKISSIFQCLDFGGVIVGIAAADSCVPFWGIAACSQQADLLGRPSRCPVFTPFRSRLVSSIAFRDSVPELIVGIWRNQAQTGAFKHDACMAVQRSL